MATTATGTIGSIGELVLDHVSFEYHEGQAVLSDLNASIAPREVVGVIGPSGSGKTTLVQLLLGLRAPTSGRVLADGRATSATSAAASGSARSMSSCRRPLA